MSRKGKKRSPVAEECAACGALAEGNFSIHRDGFMVGPDVPLCDACGGHLLPTCDDLWEQIARRRKGVL